MQFLSALFGGNESTLLNAAFALGIVLALVLLALWAVKFVLGVTNAASPMNRGRRLSVVESVQLDARHKVSIIRRDDVEYVVMTGGAQDVLLEAGIPVDRAPRRQPTRPATPVTPPVDISQPPKADTDLPQQAASGKTAAGFSPRRLTPSRTANLMRSAALRRSHVIPIQSHNDDAAPDDSATSEPDERTNGQAKLGAATTSRFPGSTFNFEGR